MSLALQAAKIGFREVTRPFLPQLQFQLMLPSILTIPNCKKYLINIRGIALKYPSIDRRVFIAPLTNLLNKISINDGYGEIRRLVALEFGNLKHPTAIDPLLRLIEQDPMPEVQDTAVFSLGQIPLPAYKKPEVEAVLEKYLKTNNKNDKAPLYKAAEILMNCSKPCSPLTVRYLLHSLIHETSELNLERRKTLLKNYIKENPEEIINYLHNCRGEMEHDIIGMLLDEVSQESPEIIDKLQLSKDRKEIFKKYGILALGGDLEFSSDEIETISEFLKEIPRVLLRGVKCIIKYIPEETAENDKKVEMIIGQYNGKVHVIRSRQPEATKNILWHELGHACYRNLPDIKEKFEGLFEAEEIKQINKFLSDEYKFSDHEMENSNEFHSALFQRYGENTNKWYELLKKYPSLFEMYKIIAGEFTNSNDLLIRFEGYKQSYSIEDI